MNILIVDDNKIVREITKEILEQKIPTINCFEAEDGEQALELINKNCFEYVLLDLDLPKLDGFEVLEKITELGIDTEVLIISGRSESECLKRGMLLGASHYIVKPINYENSIIY